MYRKALITAAIAAAATVSWQGAHATELKLAAFLPAHSVSSVHVLKPYAESVGKASGGKLTVKSYYGGALGRSPFKQYKLVTDNVTDIGYIVDIYTSGQFPDNSVFELPYIVHNATEASLAKWRMFDKGLLRGYQNVKVLGMWVSDPGGIHTRKPMKSLADLKGMKIRASGKVATAFLKKLGAVPVSMAVTKVTEAVDRGVLDGLMQSWVGLVTFRTHNVVKYHYEAPVGVINFSILMNKGAWNKLSAGEKAVLEKFGGETMARKAGPAFDKLGTARFDKYKNDKDRHIISVRSKAALAKAKAGMKDLYDDWAKNTPNGAHKLAELNKILAGIRAGK